MGGLEKTTQKKRHLVSLRLDDDLKSFIDAEQSRLRERTPGATFSMSDTVRVLLEEVRRSRELADQ